MENMMNLNKIFVGTLLLSNCIFANMDICKSNHGICSEIKENKSIMNNQKYGKKERLLAIAQISRRVGTLSKSDNRNLKNSLKTISLFKSAITGKNIFMILASPCQSQKYIVEVGFDRNYNLDFSEFRFNSVEKYNGALYLDEERYPLNDNINMKYRKALKSVIHKKVVSPKPISNSDRRDSVVLSTLDYLCVRTKSLNFRDVNNADIILASLPDGTKVQIVKKEPKSRNGIESLLVQHDTKLGYLATEFLGECR